MSVKNTAYFSILESFINDYREKYGSAPTIYEIAEGTGIPKSTVSRYLNDMRENNIIDINGRRAIMTRAAKKAHLESNNVAILGSIACGIPKFAEENIEEYVRLPISVFGKGNFYILHANGNSMVNAGIDDGDLVLIRQQNTADPGQIVVAIVDDSATLKRFYPEQEKGCIRLQSENDSMDPIYVDHCTIQGVAVKVIKNLEQV